jgi:hypothetical protein
MKINIDSSNLNTEERILKAQSVATEIYTVINSKEFEDKIKCMPDIWRHGETSHLKTLSPDDLYEFLMRGSEEWNNEVDYEMDLIVDDYYRRFSKVVGYMIPNKPTVWVNTKFFDTMSNKRCGSNFVHEWGHTMGMRHSGADYRNSLAYFLNHAYEEAHDEIFEGVEAKPRGKWVCSRSWKRLWKKKCRWQVG